MVDSRSFVVTIDEIPALLEDIITGQEAAFFAVAVLLHKHKLVALKELSDALQRAAALGEGYSSPHLSEHRLDVFYLRRLADGLAPPNAETKPRRWTPVIVPNGKESSE